MKIAIIYGEASTKHQLLIERAEELFETVLAAPANALRFVHTQEGTKIKYKDTDITEFDAAYLRHSDEEVIFSEHLGEVLNEAGVVTHLGNDTFSYMTNKFYTMKILAENNINVPDSFYTLSPDTAVEAAEDLGYPIIMKTIAGGGGQGVMRATSESELKPVMDTMKAFEQDICLQEYREHGGTDNRIIVIGDRVVSYQRSNEDDDEWRSNISGGGSRQKTELDEEMKNTAIKSTRAIGAEICGCDIIETEEDPVVLELNAAAFGLSEEINELVGEDIILGIIEWLHREVLQKQKKGG